MRRLVVAEKSRRATTTGRLRQRKRFVVGRGVVRGVSSAGMSENLEEALVALKNLGVRHPSGRAQGKIW